MIQQHPVARTRRNEMVLDPLRFWFSAARESHRLRDYKPQKVTFSSITKWLDQFESNDQKKSALFLLSKIKYYSEKDVRSIIVELNENLLRHLTKSNVNYDHILYVSLDDAGSSSPTLLGMLRDEDGLERKKLLCFSSRDIIGLIDKTNDLGNGVIVYIDDFAGTGNQFLKSRKFMADNIPLLSRFSEYIILPDICQEAFTAITKEGIQVWSTHIHAKQERQLHPHNTTYPPNTRDELTEFCKRKIDNRGALGYKGLASMVVFYRNSPNTLPVLFRGDVGQKKFIGVLPRTTDLPPIDKSTGKKPF